MLTYLWIGLGGALGSITRAWLSVAMIRLTGPQFPWGTVLINIIGSFVIAFFGTLTAAGGRFPVGADARTFVMVGICGGFTTFSSFSLQTLDLARDGRVLQAAGNVGLSLFLCLAAATVGLLAADALNPGRVIESGARPPEKAVIVTVLARPETAPGLLAAADRMLGILGPGRIEALVLDTPAPVTLMPTEEVLTADREAGIEAAREHWPERLHAMLDEWSARPGATPISWEVIGGEISDVIATEGRQADALVIAYRADHEGERARHALHAALFDAARPVLVVPPGFTGAFGRCVAVAWKEDGRAEKSVLAALPVLRQAGRVVVLRGATERLPEPGLPPLFAQHGIAADFRVVPRGHGPMGGRLIEAAHDEGADLIVMGAYTHGEWREALLGGVTRHMLAHAEVPLLMRH